MVHSTGYKALPIHRQLLWTIVWYAERYFLTILTAHSQTSGENYLPILACFAQHFDSAYGMSMLNVSLFH